MSAATPTRRTSPIPARRRLAPRRRRLARVDLGLALLAAAATVLLAPGLAVVAIVALPLFVVCVTSIVLERRRARRW
jgi:hypothetical protein